jgi:hypothetical protein
MATKYSRSNGSFHRLLACSAGGPGFDFPLRRNNLRCSMYKDVDGSGQALETFLETSPQKQKEQRQQQLDVSFF